MLMKEIHDLSSQTLYWIRSFESKKVRLSVQLKIHAQNIKVIATDTMSFSKTIYIYKDILIKDHVQTPDTVYTYLL